MCNDKINLNKINNIYTKFLNKTNGQIRSLKVKNSTFNETEGVCVKVWAIVLLFYY